MTGRLRRRCPPASTYQNIARGRPTTTRNAMTHPASARRPERLTKETLGAGDEVLAHADLNYPRSGDRMLRPETSWPRSIERTEQLIKKLFDRSDKVRCRS